MAALRLFVAIELPDTVRQALAAATARLAGAPGCGEALRPVRAEGMHLTLKFLGDVDDARLPALSDALAAPARDARPFVLRTGAPGVFGGRRNARVAWVGVDGDTAALAALAADVERACAGFGRPPERRPYSAHLTLARVRETATPEQRGAVHDAVHALTLPPSPPFTVGEYALMRSTIARGGARYDALARFPLAGHRT